MDQYELMTLEEINSWLGHYEFIIAVFAIASTVFFAFISIKLQSQANRLQRQNKDQQTQIDSLATLVSEIKSQNSVLIGRTLRQMKLTKKSFCLLGGNFM